jgi:two-component system chemotaxis response regulator CheB
MTKLIVIGGSAGGLKATKTILRTLKDHFSIPILVVLHQQKDAPFSLLEGLQQLPLTTIEGQDKTELTSGTITLAPPGYHTLVEEDLTLALDISEPVHFSRPSVDVALLSISPRLAQHTLAIILSGSNADGALGAASIGRRGGTVIIQDPKTADVDVMPLATLRNWPLCRILNLDEMARHLNAL